MLWRHRCWRRLFVGQHKWSKSIQFAERNLSIPVIAILNSPICPVRAIQQMEMLIPASPDDPSFCFPGKSSIQSLTYRIFNARLKQLVHKPGGSLYLFQHIRCTGGAQASPSRQKSPASSSRFRGIGQEMLTWLTWQSLWIRESKWPHD